MGANTEISWTDHTFNPWEGCTKVSPGCLHCYAETRNARFGGGTALNWGKGAPRRRTSVHNWNEPRRWNAEAERKMDVLTPGMARVDYPLPRSRVFCASLADWLDDEVPIEWLADLLDLQRTCTHLDWLDLSKRPENWGARIEAVMRTTSSRDLAKFCDDWRGGKAPSNIWLGTTVEDQKRADERCRLLLEIPARVHFVSAEPLIGPVDISWALPSNGVRKTAHGVERFPVAGIDWVICGGESGPGARPMHPDWARSLRDQCAAAGTAFHFKQWGEWIARSQYLYVGNEPIVQAFGAGGKFTSAVMRRDGRIDESLGEASTTNDSDSAIVRVGKKLAGRLLDGVEHNAFPEVAS